MQVVTDYVREYRDIWGAIVATLIASSIIFSVRPQVPRYIIARLKAKYFKIAKGDALGVLVCDLNGDDNKSISYLLLSHIRQNYMSPVGFNGESGKSLVAARFPLSLQGVGDTLEAEVAIKKKALKWMERSGADIIIWGNHASVGKVNTINILGIRSKERIHSQIEVDFTRGRLNEIVAESITREIFSIASHVFENPSAYDTQSLRNIIMSSKQLIGSTFPGFDSETELRIRESLDLVLNEICCRQISFLEWRDAVSNSTSLVKALDNVRGTVRWLNATKQLVSHVCRCVWSGESTDSIDFALREAELVIELSERGDAPRDNKFAEDLFFLAAFVAEGRERIMNVVCPVHCEYVDGGYHFYYADQRKYSEFILHELDEKFVVELPPKDRTCSGLRLRADELARGLIS